MKIELPIKKCTVLVLSSFLTNSLMAEQLLKAREFLLLLAENKSSRKFCPNKVEKSAKSGLEFLFLSRYTLGPSRVLIYHAVVIVEFLP